MDAQGKIYLLQTIHLCSCEMQDKNENSCHEYLCNI